MSTPCKSTDTLTLAEANCILAKRPDIQQAFDTNWGASAASDHLAVMCTWWNDTALTSATYARNNGSLDSYLREQGCRSGSSIIPPGTIPPAIGGFLTQIENWVKKNPLYAAGIAVAGVYLLTQKRRR